MSALKLIQSIIALEHTKRNAFTEAYSSQTTPDIGMSMDFEKVTNDFQMISACFQAFDKLSEKRTDDFYELTVLPDKNVDLIDLSLSLRMLGASNETYGPFSEAIVVENRIRIPIFAIENFKFKNQEPQESDFQQPENNTADENKKALEDAAKQMAQCLTGNDVLELYNNIKLIPNFIKFILKYIKDNHQKEDKASKNNITLLILGILAAQHFYVDEKEVVKHLPPISKDTFDLLSTFDISSQNDIISNLSNLSVYNTNPSVFILLYYYYKSKNDTKMIFTVLRFSNFYNIAIPFDASDLSLILLLRLTPANLDGQSNDFFNELKNNNDLFDIALNALMSHAIKFTNENINLLINIISDQSRSSWGDGIGCSTLKIMLKNYFEVYQDFTKPKCKIALYYLLQAYMDNPFYCKRYRVRRPLAIRLSVLYENLKDDVMQSKILELYRKVHPELLTIPAQAKEIFEEEITSKAIGSVNTFRMNQFFTEDKAQHTSGSNEMDSTNNAAGNKI
ncbi:MAG: hypothetical protein ABSF18_02460 [Gammaproteobacteria bacterium]|jgi:hypothetical protein